MSILRAEQALAHIDAAKREIAAAKSIDDVVDMRDKAAAVQMYAAKRKGSQQVAQDAAEIKLRCERRAGEILREMPKRRGGNSKLMLQDATPTLEQIGVDRVDSHRWQSLASLPESDFDGYLSECRANGHDITTAGAMLLAKTKRKEEKQRAAQATDSDECTIVSLDAMVAGGVKFGCIYADPPWQYGNQATRAATDNHYQTMPLDDICALPIAAIAADESHLHLWTTNGFLPDAFKVMEAWGFEYKSVMVWAKTQLGIGNYWRVSHEFLLLGVRGDLVFPQSDRPRSWIEAPRGKHSAKPEIFRQLIEKVSPQPRIELFGRKVSPGWTVWGNHEP